MCLAIPGKVESIEGHDSLSLVGKVIFGGIVREISLACLPEVKVGDYIIAHAGVALQIIDEEEALKVIDEMKELGG